jgi:glycosyltransferase involved in cell wall biosynthesis
VAPGKPIRQFPAWTDIDVFRQEGAMEVTNPWDDIVFAGMLIRLKGVHHLVNSFLRLAPEFPQARLILAGRTEDEVLTAELHARVLQAGATERVQFVGDVPQAQLAALMRQARIFVLPSYTEGLGRVVLEAMMAGTPVLASAVGGILELVQDGETGVLTPPGDEAALEERLRWLLRHPREARALGQRARDVAVRYFSSASYVQGYRDTFALAQELLDKDEVCYASAAL